MGGDIDLQDLGWNAHRHQSSPIAQPRYRFQDVEKCQKSLMGSVVQEVTNSRESFKEIMAEMVLLCTEAIRRSRSARTSSKPLSLEYIADRLDVDDPCFGYIVRSEAGHLQGFIAVTTFTNWQKTFSWDSLKEMSFYYDDASDDTSIDQSNPASENQENESAPAPNSNIEDKDNPRNTKKKNLHRSPGFKTPKKQERWQKKRKRIIDEDGSLAKELAKTVHSGDPYNEGIVWPRIAEISLLGALGCGRVLVKLVIEQLEFQRATGIANYDYIALQATDNSISFYESLGFVRVGAVCYDMKQEDENGDNDGAENCRPSSPATSMTSAATETSAAECKEKSGTGSEKMVMPATIIASPNFAHEVSRPGESPNDIAKKFKVCVWDIIFLNKDIYPELRPTSRLMKGTQLYVPKNHETDAEDSEGDEVNQQSASTPETPTKWFVAKENDTPRKIAKQFGVACNKLVSGNRRRLPELQATSRLRAGTRVKVSNLDKHDKICQPYCHWSFPEDTAVEGGDPSYIMVYKLDRKTARNPRTIRDSLGVPIGKYTPPKLLFPAPPKNNIDSRATTTPETQIRSPRLRESAKAAFEKKDLKLPKQPKRPEELKISPPESGQEVYWNHQKELHPEFVHSTPEREKIIRDRWSRLGNHKKERYHGVASEARKIYKRIEREYKGELSRWKKECDRIREDHEQEVKRKEAEAAAMKDKETSLFSKVVKIRDDALEGKDYKYWFVLTYIPDLKWCHLAPMVQEGHFGPDRKRSYGRPRYRLVDEKLGKELDISSAYCIAVKSKALKRTADADKEEWDIHDGPVALVKNDATAGNTSDIPQTTDTGAVVVTRKTLSKQPKFRSRPPVKPLNGKIAIGSTPRHSQDLLKRTRGSPVGRKRRVEEISMAERAAASKITSPARGRQRRRCMRCVDNGAPASMAVECLGAKGRFGRDACEFFDANGVSVKQNMENKRADAKMTDSSKVVTTVIASNDQIEVTVATSPPPHASYRLDASMMPSPKPTVWSSPVRNSPGPNRQKLDASE
mmetsp:Transcript_27416/g.64236  ORF Transcript_27416/g.64236 Transcript_27416/m.64236 type:complete len:1027 (+) Transcript_27416:261-3341(+)